MEIQLSDPVCGMQIESDQYTIDYLQVHYSFCSPQCQERFMKNPQQYVKMIGKKLPKKEGAK